MGSRLGVLMSGQVGRPPVPIERKRKLGNPGKRALPDKNKIAIIAAANFIPDPSRPLFGPGRDLWDRIWGAGISWISPNTDLELLVMVCEQVDERSKLRARVWNDNRNEERKALRALEREIVNNLSLLGFTPTDRSRLGVAEVHRQSKLTELRERAAQRESEQ